jgi:hypothetical protein
VPAVGKSKIEGPYLVDIQEDVTTNPLRAEAALSVSLRHLEDFITALLEPVSITALWLNATFHRAHQAGANPAYGLLMTIIQTVRLAIHRLADERRLLEDEVETFFLAYEHAFQATPEELPEAIFASFVVEEVIELHTDEVIHQHLTTLDEVVEVVTLNHNLVKLRVSFKRELQAAFDQMINRSVGARDETDPNSTTLSGNTAGLSNSISIVLAADRSTQRARAPGQDSMAGTSTWPTHSASVPATTQAPDEQNDREVPSGTSAAFTRGSD